MSYYDNAYVGVYLKIPFIKKEVKRLQYINRSGKYTTAKFCSKTGEPLKQVETTKFEIVYPSCEIDKAVFQNKFGSLPLHRFGEIHDKKTVGDFSLFIIDAITKYSTQICVDNLVLDFSNAQEILKQFKNEYSNYIEYYKSEGYGVTVCYGIIRHDYL
jgi:hypothetical protein